jgi:hypothetical protein
MRTPTHAWVLLALAARATAQGELFTLRGDAAGDQLGWSVATLGDVDGDGRSDFAAGAPGNDFAGSDAGQVKVFSGATHQVLWTLYGTTVGGKFGHAVAAAGDIDLDGRADLIVGAPGSSNTGYVRVFSGQAGAILYTLSATSADYLFGAAVAGGSDVDGDAIPDLLVGAPDAVFGDGRAHVFSGASGALIRSHFAASPGSGENLGFAVAFIGDTNGDGRGEYVIGAPAPLVGPGYVMCRNGLNGMQRWLRYGNDPSGYSEFGFALAAIGDINGNGTADVLAADRLENDPAASGVGQVRVLEAMSGTPIASYFGSVAHSGLGLALTSVGDVDGDGIDEFAAAAPGAAGASAASATAAPTEIRKFAASAALLTLPPGDANDRFGHSLASGDANGDGLRDLIVGEPLDDDNGLDSGSVHVYTFVRAPTSYCRAETNSLGCVPHVASSGTPSATAPLPFYVQALGVLSHKSGLAFYGFVPIQTAFHGGYLCVSPPTLRTPVQNSGGNAVLDCSGVFAFDFNARIQSGIDPLLVAGEEVFAQYWSRDPADPNTTNFSDALAFYVNP